MKSSFPVALHLAGKSCLVVGSGLEARDRTAALHEVGAAVRVVSEAPCTELRELIARLGVPLAERTVEEADLDGVWLAVLVDRDEALGARLAALCHARRVLFCATDQQQNNSFSHLALARAGFVTAALGTLGRAPALGRKLRQELQRVFDEAGLADFAARLAALRDATPPSERREVMTRAVDAVRFSGRLELEPRR